MYADAARALLRAVEEATDIRGRVVVGQATIDSCCDDGGWNLIVAVENIRPVAGFPVNWDEASVPQMDCPPDPAVRMHVLLMRCVPTVDEGGAPDPIEESDAHLDLLERSGQAWRAVSRLARDGVRVGEESDFQIQGGCGWIDIPVLADPTELGC